MPLLAGVIEVGAECGWCWCAGPDGRKYLHDDITVCVVILGTEGSRYPMPVLSSHNLLINCRLTCFVLCGRFVLTLRWL